MTISLVLNYQCLVTVESNCFIYYVISLMNRISLTQQFTQMFYNLSLSLECCNLYFSCRFTKKPQNENSLQVPEGNKGEEWTKPMKSRFWSLSTYNLQNLLSFLIKKNSWKIHWNISLKPWSNSLNKSHCALKKKPTLDLLTGISTNIWTPNTGWEAFDSEEPPYGFDTEFSRFMKILEIHQLTILKSNFFKRVFFHSPIFLHKQLRSTQENER